MIGKSDWDVPKMNMLTNSWALQHMLNATNPTLAKAPSMMKLIIISFSDW